MRRARHLPLASVQCARIRLVGSRFGKYFLALFANSARLTSHRAGEIEPQRRSRSLPRSYDIRKQVLSKDALFKDGPSVGLFQDCRVPTPGAEDSSTGEIRRWLSEPDCERNRHFGTVIRVHVHRPLVRTPAISLKHALFVPQCLDRIQAGGAEGGDHAAH